MYLTKVFFSEIRKNRRLQFVTAGSAAVEKHSRLFRRIDETARNCGIYHGSSSSRAEASLQVLAVRPS